MFTYYSEFTEDWLASRSFDGIFLFLLRAAYFFFYISSIKAPAKAPAKAPTTKSPYCLLSMISPVQNSTKAPKKQNAKKAPAKDPATTKGAERLQRRRLLSRLISRMPKPIVSVVCLPYIYWINNIQLRNCRVMFTNYSAFTKDCCRVGSSSSPASG